MQKLCSTCEKLEVLEIMYADLNSIKVTDLPVEIKQLKLIRCEIPLNWFKNNKFESLVEIDLSQSSRVCSKHIQDLSNCNQSLENLKLKGCFRLNDKLIEVLIDEKFKNLIYLDLEDIPYLTSLTLQLIISKFLKISPNFSNLNVKKCPKLDALKFIEIFKQNNIKIEN